MKKSSEVSHAIFPPLLLSCIVKAEASGHINGRKAWVIQIGRPENMLARWTKLPGKMTAIIFSLHQYHLHSILPFIQLNFFRHDRCIKHKFTTFAWDSILSLKIQLHSKYWFSPKIYLHSSTREPPSSTFSSITCSICS